MLVREMLGVEEMQMSLASFPKGCGKPKVTSVLDKLSLHMDREMHSIGDLQVLSRWLIDIALIRTHITYFISVRMANAKERARVDQRSGGKLIRIAPAGINLNPDYYQDIPHQ
jgi:hypothetical protein